MMDGTIKAISSVLEMRDPYTAGHERRVAQLACAIAGILGLSEQQTEGVRIAGFLHDIGKIAVPAEILSRPGKLNQYEIGIIKTHPQFGYDILKEIDFLWPVALATLQHHERLDGSGYPEGVGASGDHICIEARIIAVADVVEAMSSHRPYRAALGAEAALAEIARNRGILYSPEVVDACVRLFNELGFQFE
jgi:HD-GYP domain-containing protein (c-di-GMP phosphodiesterase class II)